MAEPSPLARGKPLNWAFIVLALVLFLTALSTWFVNQLVEQMARARFEREVDTIALTVEQRMLAYTEILRATRGLFNASENITRNDFARYVDAMELSRLYPGIQGVGYAEYVSPGELDAFLVRVREQGARDYRIWPAEARPPHVPVTYLEPRDEANEYALGFDMYSEANRREAIEQAWRAGDVAATAPVALVQEDRKAEKQTGFNIYLPVYERGASLRSIEDRRAALLGFVYAPFRGGDLLRGVNAPSDYGHIQLRVRDDGQVLYGNVAEDPEFIERRELAVAGRTWTLDFTAPPDFARDPIALTPWFTLITGLVIALAVFWAMQAQIRGRERAEEMSVRLARSRSSLDKARAEFEAIFRAMQDTAVFADEGGTVRLSNDSLARTFGYTPAELRGEKLATLHAGTGAPFPEEFTSRTTLYRRRDGSEFIGEAQRSFVRNEAGEVIGQLEVVRDMTERLKTEQALREGELRYRGVLEAMPQMVWVANPQGETLFYNNGWYEYTGLTREASLGDGFVRALHPDDVERTVHHWERAWRYGEPYEIEYRFHRADGEYHWFVGRASPIRNAEGEIIEWVGTCTDIHDRIEFEDQLRRSEARYRGLIEGMPQIVYLDSPSGNTTYFNQRWAEYVGEANAHRGLDPALLHPDDRAAFTLRRERSLSSGLPFEGEYRLRRHDGEYRTFMLRCLPVKGDDGEVIEWVGTLTDVEDQVYAETSSRLLAEVSRVLATPLSEVRDVTSVLHLLIERFAESAGLWLLDEGLLLSARETKPHLDLSALRAFEPTIEALVRRVVTSGESEILPADDELYRVGLAAMLAVPLASRNEAPFGALVLGYRFLPEDRERLFAQEVAARLAIAVDNQRLFTQAREAEREVKELNQTLEARVEQRTQELQEANRELEAFSYSVSHDLRTPLRHIVGFGDLLRKETEDTLSDKGKRYLTIMTEAATRMSSLIDDLLSFSRMGRQEIHATTVNLNDVIREARDELGPDAQQGRVRWTVDALPSVQGDANLLRLAFVNLLANALKYSRTRDEVRITVSGTIRHNEVVVAVRDNGVGFDSRFADKLFGVFQRLHRAEEFEGTGIGLANVRRIVHRHGGRVWAESELGEGATFYIALPLAAHDHPVKDPA